MIKWPTIAVTLIALVLVGVVVIDVGAPGPCDDANQLRKSGRLSEARTAYVALLDDRPPPDCAAKGVRATARAQCRAVLRLASFGLTEEAKKAYVTLASAEPFGARKCVRKGLPVSKATCAAARKLLDRGLLTKARTSYITLLESDDQAGCATKALIEINDKRCALVKQLREAGFPKRARALAGKVASEEPYGTGGSCVEAGVTAAQ